MCVLLSFQAQFLLSRVSTLKLSSEDQTVSLFSSNVQNFNLKLCHADAILEGHYFSIYKLKSFWKCAKIHPCIYVVVGQQAVGLS